MSYWISTRTADLLDALQSLRPRGRSSRHDDAEVRLGLIEGEAVVSTVGREERFEATGLWPGYASCSLRQMFAFLKLELASDTIQVQYGDGKLRVQTLRIPARWTGASELVAAVSLEGHFQNALGEGPRLFCPACGKQSTVSLANYLATGPADPAAHALMRLASEARATHGCTSCGHGWAELEGAPGGQLRLL